MATGYLTTRRDGREILNVFTVKGRAEYIRRVEAMVDRQGGRCAICGEPILPGCIATFDHEKGRGMGGSIRDDRIEIRGKWINGAAHWLCNSEKGSRRRKYVIRQPRG